MWSNVIKERLQFIYFIIQNVKYTKLHDIFFIIFFKNFSFGTHPPSDCIWNSSYWNGLAIYSHTSLSERVENSTKIAILTVISKKKKKNVPNISRGVPPTPSNLHLPLLIHYINNSSSSSENNTFLNLCNNGSLRSISPNALVIVNHSLHTCR